MAPRPGASDSQMVPIEEVERARKAAEDCAAKRDACSGSLWNGIKSASGACNTLSWKLFGIGLSICGIVMTGVLIYMSSVSVKADEVARVVATKADEIAKTNENKNEKQDDRLRQIELQVVKEISEMNVKMIDVQALLAAQAQQRNKTP